MRHAHRSSSEVVTLEHQMLRRAHRPLRVVLAMGVVLTLLVAATATTLAAPLQLDDDPEGTGREPDHTGARVEIALGNGNELSFVPMYSEKGHVESYGVMEKIVPGGQEIAQMREFRGLNPVELMFALTPSDTKLPAELVELYGQPSRGDQGWGLGLVPGPAHGGGNDSSSCMNPGSFDNNFPGYQKKFVTLNDGPDTVPSHWLDGPGDEFYTWGRVFNVRQYYTKVTRCNVDEDQWLWAPYVHVGYRNNQNYPAWGVATAAQGSLDGYGSSFSFTWHPPAPSSLYDFQVFIDGALNDDTFHIGIEWSKAFGFTMN